MTDILALGAECGGCGTAVYAHPVRRQGELDMASKGYLTQMRGFTLIEISIVLVVIGLLLSGGLVALGPVIQNAKRTQTENTLTKIEDALLLYAIQNSCLPCPADGTAPGTPGAPLITGDATYGTACTASACRGNNSDNVVPWLALGLSPSDVLDEWGTQITYHLSTAAATAGGVTTFCDNLQNSANADNSAAGGLTRNGTGPVVFPDGCLDLENADPTAFTDITERAAYVLISHGPDTSGGFSENGATRTNAQTATNTVQDQNNDGSCDGLTPCHQGDPVDLSTDDYFDDIVRWKTGPVLVFQCGDGACGNP